MVYSVLWRVYSELTTFTVQRGALQHSTGKSGDQATTTRDKIREENTKISFLQSQHFQAAGLRRGEERLTFNQLINIYQETSSLISDTLDGFSYVIPRVVRTAWPCMVPEILRLRSGEMRESSVWDVRLWQTMSAITTNMKHLTELILLTNLLLITKSASDFEFEEDFIHSFLIKSEKLTKSERLKTADSNWLKGSSSKVNMKVNLLSQLGLSTNISYNQPETICKRSPRRMHLQIISREIHRLSLSASCVA